jgi:hypothetical protein
MKPESRALGQVLLDHHRCNCVGADDITVARESCLITYGQLCADAGIPQLIRVVGMFLKEIAEWCSAEGWPPLNALAVNAETRMPGESYDVAPGCSLLNWPSEVDSCIRFQGYPERMP